MIPGSSNQRQGGIPRVVAQCANEVSVINEKSPPRMSNFLYNVLLMPKFPFCQRFKGGSNILQVRFFFPFLLYAISRLTVDILLENSVV